MIDSIVLENFKCFRKVEVNPRLITVFVGPNGTGKSSVLQAMVLLKQSAGRSGLNLAGMVNFPSYEDIVAKFGTRAVRLRLGFDGRRRVASPLSPFPKESEQSVVFSVRLQFEENSVTSQWGSISFLNGKIPVTLTFDPKQELEPERIEVPGGSLGLTRTREIGELVRIGSYSGDLQRSYELMTSIVSSPARVLEDTRYVPAVRGLVRPDYALGDNVVADISLSGGLSRQEEQTATNLGYSRELENTLSDWVKKVTGVGVRGSVIPSQAVKVDTLTAVGAVNIVADGFGTNSLVLLLMQLASASKGATVMMEEPEIHLHPRGQADLVSLLVDVAKLDEKQLIMTTHSEHIVGRLLTLVAEKKLSPGELAIYAFEKDKKGVCTANELEVTKDGRVKGGIKDFFESDLAELDRYVKALQSGE